MHVLSYLVEVSLRMDFERSKEITVDMLRPNYFLLVTDPTRNLHSTIVDTKEQSRNKSRAR